MNKSSFLTGLFLILFAIAALFLLVPYIKPYFLKEVEPPTEQVIDAKLKKENDVFTNLSYDLSDPEEAPEEIKSLVLKGYEIMVSTRVMLPDFAPNLNCTNCHFIGGNTTGGKNGGLSLAGVAALYPRYDGRFKKVINLQERINSCFEKSMNGKPLPYNSPEMLALETYFYWISKGLPIFEPVPWIGTKPLKIEDKPDVANGKVVYQTYCLICHRTNGEGTSNYPAVWGERSYNAQAGLNEQALLESFIWTNMPYNDPQLSEKDARDVAAFIRSQPRPGR